MQVEYITIPCHVTSHHITMWKCKWRWRWKKRGWLWECLCLTMEYISRFSFNTPVLKRYFNIYLLMVVARWSIIGSVVYTRTYIYQQHPLVWLRLWLTLSFRVSMVSGRDDDQQQKLHTKYVSLKIGESRLKDSKDCACANASKYPQMYGCSVSVVRSIVGSFDCFVLRSM